ncbi:MAG: ABC transporter family substrate-binding protein [Propionibacteriaceae bacterium]|jgi:peptide/nickel transport system substrate-binding protein|nr:ABC transporter family substrate-binding protein [Propionibacteriaceae bacterium]
MTMAACGGPSDEGGDAATTGSSTDTGSGSNNAVIAEGWDVNPVAYEDVPEGGEFTASYGSELDTFNLNTAAGNDAEISFALSPVMGPWYFMDGAGALTENPDYIDEITDEVVDGKLVVNLKINEKAVWNDGQQIDADDWIATWKAMNGSNTEFSVASTDGWKSITSVEAGETPQDVVVTFESTYPDWQALFTGGPMRAESVADPATFNDGWADFNNDWFSGPFIIQSFDKTSGELVMVPNTETWWGQAPRLEKITFKMVSSAQTATAFANGEIDYIDIASDVDAYTQASARSDAVIRQSLGPNYRHFTFNSQAPILSDVNLRQALVMGLDRTKIAESDLAGLPVDPTPLNNNIFMENQEGYVDLGAETGIDYDPEGAKAKLDELGWTLNEATGFREKDGQQLDVRFAMLTDVATSENEALLAQNQLKEIGVNVVIQSVDTQTQWPSILDDGDFDIIAFAWIGTAWPLRNVGQIYGAGSDSNYARLDNPTLDALLPQLDSEMDEAARLKLGQDAALTIWESVHTLPLYQRPALAGVTEGLANVGSWGLARNPYDWTAVGYVES